MEEWKILIVVFPAVAAIIGYVTNMVALKMLFKPYDPVKLGPLAFQGVIPKHYAEYVNKIADIATGNFLTTQELVSMLNPEELAVEFKDLFDKAFDEAIDEARQLAEPKYAAMLQPPMSEELRKQAWQEVLKAAPKAVEGVVERAEDLVDMHDFIVEKNMAIGPQGMERVINEISGHEMAWIEYFGGIFGIIIGLLQFGFVSFFPAAEEGQVGLVLKLAMPIFGCIVGLITNYLAVQMLWKPREPWGWWIFKYQGMFPKRQKEVQAQLAEMSAREFIITSEIFTQMTDHLTPELIEAKILEQHKELPKTAPGMKKLLDDALPGEKQEHLIRVVASRIVDYLPEAKRVIVEFADSRLDVLKILLEKGEMVDRADFENYLRDIMKKEELYLVIYGGVLGAAMGGAQLGLYIMTMAWKYAQEQGMISFLF